MQLALYHNVTRIKSQEQTVEEEPKSTVDCEKARKRMQGNGRKGSPSRCVSTFIPLALALAPRSR